MLVGGTVASAQSPLSNVLPTTRGFYYKSNGATFDQNKIDDLFDSNTNEKLDTKVKGVDTWLRINLENPAVIRSIYLYGDQNVWDDEMDCAG